MGTPWGIVTDSRKGEDMELAIGVVGLGAIGRDHVKRFHERITGCKVVAVSEVK